MNIVEFSFTEMFTLKSWVWKTDKKNMIYGKTTQ